MRVWIASGLFYAFIYIICEFSRYTVFRFLTPHLDSTFRSLLFEFIGTLQLCAPMFDVGLILDMYGLFGVFIEITLLEVINAFLFRDALGHPCPLVITATRKRSILRRAALVFIVQLFAAYLSYFLARTFWKLGVHPKHVELLNEQHCHADLNVAITTGCLIEGFATFGCRAMEYFCEREYKDFTTRTVANAIFNGFIVALGINMTGMYANPIVAWACTFNCEGLTHMGHLIVYWISPLVGWYFADAVFGEAECNLNDGDTLESVFTEDLRKIT
ncbi:hypothetical protein AB6A40_005729 [Gnathostoma spinigerum]|uniref:Aquaporin n=1 Tax=Gnathostoma spinigerum TaxID=75299 RepID=A0ABD6ERY4_9BILA